MVTRLYVSCFFALVALLVPAFAQSSSSPQPGQSPAAGPEKRPVTITFRGDAAVVSKYIWRGQCLTNDWSLQPSATVGAQGFALNIWGSLDMVAVNEGDSLHLPGNPEPPDRSGSGLRGKFSEVDYTFSYSREVAWANLTGGTIIYTFPERSVSLPTTSELYAGVTLKAPLSPSATIFADVDETSREDGTTGLYLKLSGAHSFRTGRSRAPSVDISAWLGVVNGGFGNYYYGVSKAGFHDANVTVAAPLKISERWSASLFVAYSGLLGDFRRLQYPDLRDVYRGVTGPGHADNLWGGGSVSLVF